MLEAIAELARCRPHMREGLRLEPLALHGYHEGYYAGVVYALRVATAALERRELLARDRRAAVVEKRSA